MNQVSEVCNLFYLDVEEVLALNVASQKKRKKRNPGINLVHFTRKSIGVIHISNDLTLNERKVANLLIKNAQDIERDVGEYNKTDKFFTDSDNNTYYKTNFEKIEEILGLEKYVHRQYIKEILHNLASTALRYNILNRDNTNKNGWEEVMALLSYVKYRLNNNDPDSTIYYYFSSMVKDVIIKPALYAPIDLNLQKEIRGKSSLALLEYFSSELAINQTDELTTKPIALTDYVYLVAGSKVSYEKFKYINEDLIKKPLQEINSKSTLVVEAIPHKKGREVTAISHHIKRKDEYSTPLFDVNLNPCLMEATQHNNYKDLPNKSDNIGTRVNTKVVNELEFNNDTPFQISNAKENTTCKASLTQKEKEQQTITELLIKSNISQKKREEFVERHSLNYILENIESAKNFADLRKTDVSAPLIIKAIEDNWANSGPEKERLKEKEKLLSELKEVLHSYDTAIKYPDLTRIYTYIGNTIQVLKRIDNLVEEEWLSSYKYQEFNKKANFSSLIEFKEAVKKESINQIKNIKDRLGIIKERYNLSLDDICETHWNTTKEELFKRMGIVEEEFWGMVSSVK